jgi:hypothetical protein
MEQSKSNSEGNSLASEERRQSERLAGPFDGMRIGVLETPVRIYDLSEGGCFINSLHDQQPGVAFRLKIDLPYAGWVHVKAETLYLKPGFGFAVRFIEMTEETETRLRLALQQLKALASGTP